MKYLEIDFTNINGFIWDKGNVNKNRLKHQVETSECEEVFFNKPIIILSDEKHSLAEQRYKIIGVTNNRRRLSLAITIRNTQIRVIMARDQSKKEKTLFETEKSNRE
jgi:uncharacterized protein